MKTQVFLANIVLTLGMLGFCSGAVPVFVNPDPLGTTVIPVTEDTPLGSTIYTLSATDADGDPLTYGLFTGVGFSVVSDEVVTAMVFDISVQSVHSITVSASDGVNTVYISMLITIAQATDPNPNAPEFLPTLYSTSVAENTAQGTSLMDLTCTDVENSGCALSIHSGDDAQAKFSISGSTLQTTSTAIDYESFVGQSPLYTLVITGVDDPGSSDAKTATASVFITITSENDNQPVISGPSSANVSENDAAGSTVCTITASDADEGDDGIMSYNISGGNSDNLFGIDSSTALIYLKSTLDYENEDSHLLTIEIIDGGGTANPGTTSHTLTINVLDENDNSPDCPSSIYTFNVDEQTSATPVVVTTLSCTDVDTNNAVSYSITSGNSESCFSLDTSTGVLSTACTLDYDTGSQQYSLVVTVTDGTHNTLVTVVVNVDNLNDDTPAFGSSPTVNVAEDTALGTSLTTFNASDSDASPDDIGKYEITSVTNNGIDLFTIDMSSGEIYLAQSLDFEGTDTYVITVEASDGTATGSGSVTISVTDVNDNTPTCTPSSYVGTVSEDAALTTTVFTDLGCTDADSSTNLQYTITSQPSGSNFETLSSSGVVSIVVNDALDFETANFYKLVVTASDGANTATVTLAVNIGNVNEHTPAFTTDPYMVTWPENTSVGTVLVTVTATDADSDTVSYVFVTSYAGFTIDSTSGSISLVNSLDYESSPSHDLLVKGSDGTYTATVTVSITVTDVVETTASAGATTTKAAAAASSGTSSDAATSSNPSFFETTTGIAVTAGAGALGLAILTTTSILLYRSCKKTGEATLTRSSKVNGITTEKSPTNRNGWMKKSFRIPSKSTGYF